MRRAIALLAVALLMMFTFTPQTVTPQANPSTSTSDQPAADDNDTPRNTLLDQPSRTARPVTTPKPLTLTVVRGDTYGAWALAHCGSINAWPAIQAANGWPERGIPVGKTATIVCTAPAAPTLASSTPQTPQTPSAAGAWVHPLASGKTATSAGLCWGAARVGHTHKGVDLTQPSGTPIRSVSAGTVKVKAYSGTAGNYITIAHQDNVSSRYMHLRAPSPLAVGAKVQAGQTIGYVGATGNAQGPHLHFEILIGGRNTNPAIFMRRNGVNVGC